MEYQEDEVAMKNRGGYLGIARRKNQKYYLFITGTDRFIEVQQGTMYRWKWIDKEINRGVAVEVLGDIKSRHYIMAPEGVEVVREELLESVGGLEQAVKISVQGKKILGERKNLAQGKNGK